MSIELTSSDWCEDDAVYEGRSLIIKLFGLMFVFAVARR